MNTASDRSIESLNARHAIANVARVEAGNGGLPRVVVDTGAATAHVYLHGAHVTHFAVKNPAAGAPAKPMLFMSGKSHFEAGKPIRGGVPICFPWFGPHPSDKSQPAHGFARLMAWNLNSIRREQNGDVVVELSLESGDATRKYWPGQFIATHAVRVGASAQQPKLTMSLSVKNAGAEAFEFEEALHTYLVVDDVRKTTVSGLEDAQYLDKTSRSTPTPASRTPVDFTGETDRVYLATVSACRATDSASGRTIRVDKTGSTNTVVWNPWIAKAQAMPDFGDDEWPGMVCIETANVRTPQGAGGEGAITLAPGAQHVMSATVSVD